MNLITETELLNRIRALEKKLESARSALRVIHTWSTFRGGALFDPDSTARLAMLTLKETQTEVLK